jgi:hypothetical protein
MKKFLFLLFICCSCESDPITEIVPKDKWMFVACEGNFGSSNGSIYMINQKGDVKSIDDIGDVVQSLEVYKNKLFVIVNNSHKIMAYDITVEGLRLPGIEISTENSSPREMKIINDKLYFTNWNSSDVKVLNLITYSLEDSIKVEGKPESIEVDGQNLWVGIQMNNDYSDGNKLLKINTSSNSIIGSYEIGKGPTSISIVNQDLYVANTYYDSNYNAYYGTTRFNSIEEVSDIKYYGAGVVCGGSVMEFSNYNSSSIDSKIFRSFEGGAALIGKDLEIVKENKLGSYEPSQVYHIEAHGDYMYFGLTNYTDINQVKVVDVFNKEIASYDVGLFPGDFAFWESN